VILGYTARINPRAVGGGFEVLVLVDLTRKDRTTFEAVEAAVAALDEVVETTRLGDVPGVDKLDSHMTMKLIKSPEHDVGAANARRLF